MDWIPVKETDPMKKKANEDQVELTLSVPIGGKEVGVDEVGGVSSSTTKEYMEEALKEPILGSSANVEELFSAQLMKCKKPPTRGKEIQQVKQLGPFSLRTNASLPFGLPFKVDPTHTVKNQPSVGSREVKQKGLGNPLCWTRNASPPFGLPFEVDPTHTVKQPSIGSGEAKEVGGASSSTRKGHIEFMKESRFMGEEESLPRFGPFNRVDQPSVDAIKEKSWQHLLRMSALQQNFPSVEAIEDIYLVAVGRVEQEAREMYGLKSSDYNGSSFRSVMMKDGCFVLQLGLKDLGCAEQLGYPANDLIFGKESTKKDVNKRAEAIFYKDNQIPLVVLNELMKQTFFQTVIKQANWDTPQSSLYQKALYEFLVKPALGRDQTQWPSLREIIFGKREDGVSEQQLPCHLLQGLRNLVTGPNPPRLGVLSDTDLEANYLVGEVSDYESTSDDGDDKGIFPSATELKRAGIRIKKLQSGGTRSICFVVTWYGFAYLYLPVIAVDDNTETLFWSLTRYEKSQQFGRNNRREVSSYLRAMSSIIPTRNDAQVLEKAGIIQGSSYNEVKKLSGMLRKLMSSEGVGLTHEFWIMGHQMRDYTNPWIRYKGIISLALALTLLQAFFAVLAYFRPPKP